MYRVIVVEDDPMIANIAKAWVESCADCTVVGVFHNGEDALAFQRQVPADLVLLDINLPGMTGLELLAAMRAEGMETDAVIASVVNTAAAFRTACSFGALDYLIKPYDEPRLRQAIALFAHKRRLIDAGTPLTQVMVDSVILPNVKLHSGSAAKGIQKPTLQLVRGFLQTSAPTDRLTNETISIGTGLSVVSVRRYMNHLTDLGEVTVEMEYNTGGRPVTVYRKT